MNPTRYDFHLARLGNLETLTRSTADGYALDGYRTNAATMLQGVRRIRRVRARYVRRFAGRAAAGERNAVAVQPNLALPA